MATTITILPTEVTFMTPTGAMEIRMSEHTPEAIRDAARTLKARFYVSVVDWCAAERLPVWGVFAGDGIVPVRVFTTESSAPAVMFAAIRAPG